MKNQTEALYQLHILAEPIDWDAVYRSELPRIYNYFLYRLAHMETAQDMTAITFERAWKHRSRYRRTISALPTWLFGIARNVLKEYLRKTRVRGRRLEQISRIEELLNDADIENSVQQRQENDRLRQLLLDLPERERDLIALKYGAGLTNREIARITRLTETNVGSILHRSVAGLRNRWEDDHGR